MKKVTTIFVWILLGIVAGIITTIKWIAPPGTKYEIGKIKAKGRGNTQTTTIEISNIPSKREIRRQRREIKKQNKKNKIKS